MEMEFWTPVFVIVGVLGWFPAVVFLFLIGRGIYLLVKRTEQAEAPEQAAELEGVIAAVPTEQGAEAREHQPTKEPVTVR